MMLRKDGYTVFYSLKAAYPEHDWKPWLFRRAAGNALSEIDAQRQFFEWAFKFNGFSSLDDWYRVRYEDLAEQGARNFIGKQYGGSVPAALSAVFPHHPWDRHRFGSSAERARAIAPSPGSNAT